MRRRHPDPQARDAACLEIVRAVNRFKVRHAQRMPFEVRPKLLELRHINRAVKIARPHGLVKPEVLAAAGFRTKAAR